MPRRLDMTRNPIPASAFAALAALEAYTRTAVSRDDSHLVRLRASWLNGCRFCMAMHRRDARKSGWSQDRIVAVEKWTTNPESLSGADVAVLRLTDAVTRINGEESVPDSVWDDVVAHRGQRGAGQLLVEIATINAWNRVAIATQKDPRGLRGLAPEDLPPVTPSAECG